MVIMVNWQVVLIPHPHSEYSNSFNYSSNVIDAEAEASHKILNEKGVCHMCQTINEELSGPRQILAN